MVTCEVCKTKQRYTVEYCCISCFVKLERKAAQLDSAHATLADIAKLVGVDPAEKDGERLYHAVKVGVALVEELLAAAKEIPATLNRFLVTDPGDLTGCTQRGAYHQAIRDISMSTAVTNLEAALAKAEGAK